MADKNETTEYEKTKVAQLERKLQLFLGTREEWLSRYRTWLFENAVTEARHTEFPPAAYDDHQINLFVNKTRRVQNEQA